MLIGGNDGMDVGKIQHRRSGRKTMTEEQFKNKTDAEREELLKRRARGAAKALNRKEIRMGMRPRAEVLQIDQVPIGCQQLIGHKYTPMSPNDWHKQGIHGQELQIVGFKSSSGTGDGLFEFL
jgi:G:T/U-mismatch repair DNA glycosylase